MGGRCPPDQEVEPHENRQNVLVLIYFSDIGAFSAALAHLYVLCGATMSDGKEADRRPAALIAKAGIKGLSGPSFKQRIRWLGSRHLFGGLGSGPITVGRGPALRAHSEGMQKGLMAYRALACPRGDESPPPLCSLKAH